MKSQFDVVVIGGGIAGSALSSNLAKGGLNVLLLESELKFRDKVQGEIMAPWGVVEAKRLDVESAFMDAGGVYIPKLIPYDEIYEPAEARMNTLELNTLLADTNGSLSVGHPQACQALLHCADEFGATVVRGSKNITIVKRASQSSVLKFLADNEEHEVSTRLIVGADGRRSCIRKQLGLQITQSDPLTMGAGLLLRDVKGLPSDEMILGTANDVYYLIFPRPNNFARVYLVWDVTQRTRFAGRSKEQLFLQAFKHSCLPYGDSIAAAVPAGPCASYPFNCGSIESEVVPGAVLIGDAAGWNDPIIGQGLSIALRDARWVANILTDSDDWSVSAFDAYVHERRERMRRLAIAAELYSHMRCTFGDRGKSRRKKWMQLFYTDELMFSTVAATLIGPENALAEGFLSEHINRALAL